MYPPNESLLVNSAQVSIGDLRAYIEPMIKSKDEDTSSMAVEIVDAINTLQGLLEEWENGDY